ncbi:hypothetical protein CR513_52614, partial [Mucuna pruriens]
MDRKIKYLKSNNGLKNMTPQHNGVAERMNRSTAERARCLRLDVSLLKGFLAEKMSMTSYLINRLPWVSSDRKVIEEV